MKATRSTNKGFVPGLKQPVGEITTEIIVPQSFDLEEFDAQIKLVLETDLEALSKESKNNSDLGIIERYLLICSLLFCVVGIPVFDIGRVTSRTVTNLSNGQRKLKFSALVPNLNYVAPKDRVLVYRTASGILSNILFRAPSTWHPLLEKVNEQILLPLKHKYRISDSMVPLLHKAYLEDIPFFRVTSNCFQLGWGQNAHLISSSVVDTDSAIGAKLSANKVATIQTLRAGGFPVPTGVTVSSKEKLTGLMEHFDWPVVIKPIDRERGEGVTTGIASITELESAYDKARGFSARVMLEEHIEGFVHRITIVGGIIAYVNKRLPKSVWGDGVSTIEKLIDDANLKENKKAPWLRLKPFPKDEKAIHLLKHQGFDLASVPGNSELILLRPLPSIEDGGSADILTEQIHPENVKLAKSIAKLFRVTSLGIDFLTTDISRPWYETGGKINEVNFSPHISDHFCTRSKSVHGLYMETLSLPRSRIPISVFVGDDKAWQEALDYKATLDNHAGTFISSDRKTLDENGEPLVICALSFEERWQALSMNKELKHLILVVSTDEFLEVGLPFDRVDSVIKVNGVIKEFRGNGLIETNRVALLVEQLEGIMQ